MATYDYKYGDERKFTFSTNSDEITEVHPNGTTGRTFSTINKARSYYESDQKTKLNDLKASRDITSDLENLPGTKPLYEDDWLPDVPDQFERIQTSTGVKFRIIPALADEEVIPSPIPPENA